MQWTVSDLSGTPDDGWDPAAVTVGHHKVFSFGGRSTNKARVGPMDVHVFNTESLRWRTLPAAVSALEVPSRRGGHTAVLVGDIVYIWGGVTETRYYCNVLYAFDVDAHTWSKPSVSGTVPEGRYGHSACVVGKVMFIYGGSNNLNEWPNYIYKLDTTTMVWTLINTRGTAPPATSWHSATTIGTWMFVFGGYRDQVFRKGDPYCNPSVFDTETNQWVDTPSTQPLPGRRYAPQDLPERRRGHSAFTYNGEMYIFGGREHRSTMIMSDLWKFSPETFSWKEVTPKGNGPSRINGCCCCIVGDRIIVFGASCGGLFILDLSPSLKTLCKLAVIQYDLEQSELPHNIRWELAAMKNNTSSTQARSKRSDSDIVRGGTALISLAQCNALKRKLNHGFIRY